MKTIHTLFIGLAVIFLTSCNPKVITSISKNYPALVYNQEVLVINMEQPQPENAEVLGEVGVGDTGFTTNCGYEVVVEKAKAEARAVGGNALKLTRHVLPSAFGSTCHQITATILKMDDIQNYNSNGEKKEAISVVSDVQNNTSYYDESEQPPIVPEPIKFPRVRVAVNGGYSYQIAKISDDVPDALNDYIKGLKSGYHFGGDVNYFFSEIYGIGAKYTVFRSQNSLDNVYFTLEDGSVVKGNMSDDLSITFIGPTFSIRSLNATKKDALMLNFSIGYMGYRDDKVLLYPGELTGSTVGFGMEIGYDIGLGENLALGFQFSLLGGALSQYEVTSGGYTQKIKLESGEYESLSRIDLSVGLRFIK